jgi:hypothetical protein
VRNAQLRINFIIGDIRPVKDEMSAELERCEAYRKHYLLARSKFDNTFIAVCDWEIKLSLKSILKPL